ncbi:unnamed protein product, partial [Sphagnum jensenii]
DVMADVSGGERELLYIRKGEETEWMGVKRKDRKFIQHDACCFGINHRIDASHHHLYMLDVAAKEDPPEESTPIGESIATQDEPVQQKDMLTAIKRKRPQYLDKQQQLELVLAVQELSELGDPDLSPTCSDNENECEVRIGCLDIWQDVDYLTLLKGGVLTDTVNLEENRRIRKKGMDMAAVCIDEVLFNEDGEMADSGLDWIGT